MMSMTLICALMLVMMSPIKIAFSVTLMSILASFMSYNTSSSVFPASAITISFSSGMMILFCYCAMMTTYESKNYSKKMTMVVLVMTTPLLMTISEVLVTSSNDKTNMALTTSPLIATAMAVVLLAMTSINLSMFSPTKSFISSY